MSSVRRDAALAFLVLLNSCTGPTGGDSRTLPGGPTGKTEPSTKTRAGETRPAETACREREASGEVHDFVPDTYREGADVVLPVVFPDGTSAELVYPPRLRLAELGVQPAASVEAEKPRDRYLHEYLLVTRTPLEEIRTDDPPISTYEGPSGTVNVWRAENPRDLLNPVFLHFRIGTWNVVVGDGNAGSYVGRDNRRLLAENLDGQETKSGFLVLDPRPPLGLAADPGGPRLYLHRCFRLVELRREECKDLSGAKLARGQTAHTVRGVTVHRNRSRRQFYANWCTRSGRISVYLDDHEKRFVDLAVRTLRIRRVTPGDPAPSQ